MKPVVSCIDKTLRVVGHSRGGGCDPVSRSWFPSGCSGWVFLHWEGVVLLAASLGLLQSWAAAPQAAVPGCWGAACTIGCCLHVWQCPSKPWLLNFISFFFLRMLLCLAGIAGSVATLLHDAVMNPAEGNALCCRGSAAPC